MINLKSNQIKIKTFYGEYPSDVDKEVNKWLAKKNHHIIDIKTPNDYEGYYIVTVIYKKED